MENRSEVVIYQTENGETKVLKDHLVPRYPLDEKELRINKGSLQIFGVQRRDGHVRSTN